MPKTIVALRAPDTWVGFRDLEPVAAHVGQVAPAAGVERLALDLPADPSAYEHFGRRSQQAPAWNVVAHVWHRASEVPEVPIAGLVPVRAWRVDEHVAWDYDRTWADGVATPGIKQISFVGRRLDVTDDQFAQRYRGHAAVARVHHAHVWKYGQNVVARDASDPIAAVSESWFRSIHDLTARYYTFDDSRAVTAADVATFLDPATTSWMLVHEHCMLS